VSSNSRPDRTVEQLRIEATANGSEDWKSYGPWIAERAWGTVREDYSADGDAWSHLPYDEARRTAYRWNEDGLAGICDAQQLLCLAFAFWNGRDDYLKERAFGLAGPEGNHGEDVKELWWYVDATPTASYLRWRYHYPQQAFPYDDLRATNAARSKAEPEYELADTGVLERGYWQIELTVAKAMPNDLVLELVATNRGPVTDTLHVLPTLWFRNRWSWSATPKRPVLRTDGNALVAEHPDLGTMRLQSDQAAVPLVCDNDTDTRGRYGDPTGPAYPKNGIGDYVVSGSPTVHPDGVGTKGALHHQLTIEPGASGTITLRFCPPSQEDGMPSAAAVLKVRRNEADAFHASVLPDGIEPDSVRASIARQAFAGLVWGQCFYHYDVQKWLDGDPGQPPPPSERRGGRNAGWWHLNNRDVLSMPDAWEYPWYAAWDLAFHAVTLAHIDPNFAKDQLILLTREWFMSPSGQLPAYEWNFSDVNPPVHAWAALEVFKISGGTDYLFLQRVFHKLLMNHTWWTNREDAEGNNVFEGGFLGLDNVGAFDRSHLPPGVTRLEQADATAWMAMYCLDLLDAALVLARHNPAFEDIATKFFEHFTYIAKALDGLWDEEDGFYYDMVETSDGALIPMRVRSVAGLVVLAANRVIPPDTMDALPAFAARVRWFMRHNAQLDDCLTPDGQGGVLLSAVPQKRLRRVLDTVLDEKEFLSPHGLRSLSKWHADHPFTAHLGAFTSPAVDYEPAESRTGLFGGNSNWRGPVWFPLNHLVITGLRRIATFDGPQPSLISAGEELTPGNAATLLANRLIALFEPGSDGQPPAAQPRGGWPDGLLQFHEYFDGDTGAGLGAAHQTGWTALVADLILRHTNH
jgi:hypothetical protein